ncbi:putative invertase inhibitor [Malania oleifera]|uniref:putative invertase inhibitor n=1 Tax=Malania oleifera TaxID=397392 RepID=UPI0025ADB64D|nr:putative invertase inhibitor [Malania oleifera]
MKSSALSFFILSFFLIYGAHGEANFIAKVCKDLVQADSTMNYAFCMESLQAIPKSHKASLRGLGFFSMSLVQKNALRIGRLVQNLLNSQDMKMSDYTKNCLKDCSELYADAVDSVKEAVDSFKGRDYDSANIKMSAAMDASSTCEDQFKEGKGSKSPMTESSKQMFQLSGMALTIINMLHRH